MTNNWLDVIITIEKRKKEVIKMVYVEFYDCGWHLAKMNIFRALFCVLFDTELSCRIVPKNEIEFY